MFKFRQTLCQCQSHSLSVKHLQAVHWYGIEGIPWFLTLGDSHLCSQILIVLLKGQKNGKNRNF